MKTAREAEREAARVLMDAVAHHLSPVAKTAEAAALDLELRVGHAAELVRQAREGKG